MKKLILAAALILGVGCSHHSKSAPPAEDNVACNEAGCPIKLPQTEVIKDTIQEENWQFVLPGEGWTPLHLDADSVIKVAFKNTSSNSIVFFAKEQLTSNPVQYIINTMHTINTAGLKTTGADQVSVNGRRFVMLTSAGEDVIWTWITFNKGYAYVFSCGATDSDGGATDRQLCQDVVNTLQIQ